MAAEVVCYDVVEHRQNTFHCKQDRLRSMFLFSSVTWLLYIDYSTAGTLIITSVIMAS